MCYTCLTSSTCLINVPVNLKAISSLPSSQPTWEQTSQCVDGNWCKGERKDCPMETSGAPPRAPSLLPKLNCELVTNRKFSPGQGRNWDRDEKPPAPSALGHKVIPQRKGRALAYEKYTKQYNYQVLVNIFPTTAFPSKDQATGPGRSL